MPDEGLKSVVIAGDPAKPIPDRWEECGVVDKIFVYPMKSAKGVRVSEAEAFAHGLSSGQYSDRRLVATSANNRFVTGRKYPKMVLIEASVSEDRAELVLRAPWMKEACKVSLPDDWKRAKKESVQIWKDDCAGIDLGAPVGRWLSKCLTDNEDEGLKLFWHGDPTSSRPRHKEGDPITPLLKTEDTSFYADLYPILLLSQQSVDGLNQQLLSNGVDLKVDERRFRPNIFIKDAPSAHSEDRWPFFRIGDAVFRNVQLCSRCVFTTVDPDKGEKDKGGEPLKTLQKYRQTLDEAERKKFGTSPLFATNLAVAKEGKFRAGDKVYVGKL